MDLLGISLAVSFLFLFGLAIGSFLNVVIYRTLNDESPLEGRSRCPHCRHQIRWFDNIPLLSFIVLKGRCRDCKKSISWMYPLVELTTGLLFAWWFVIGFSLYFQLTQEPFGLIQKIFWLVIAILFIIIFFTDLISLLIPDYAVYGVFVLGVLYRISLGLADIMRWQDVGLTLLGSLIVTTFFLLLWWFTKKKGMGFGDVQLVAGLAILVGWPHVFLMTFLGFLYGSLIATVMLFFRRKTLKHTLPFGPFLILSTITTLVWGDHLLHWYLQML